MSGNEKSGKKLSTMTLYAMFTAIIFILGMTPLGLLNLPWAAITTLHVPVIIGAVLLGIKGGAVLGFVFGTVSLIRCFTSPDAIAVICLGTGGGFGLKNLLLIIGILFVPRILVGVFSALVYKAIFSNEKIKSAAIPITSIVGSLTNSIFVLGGLSLLARSSVAEILGKDSAISSGAIFGALVGLNSINVICEAILAVILCSAIGHAVLAYTSRRKSV